jgi:hypothetical protein
MLRCWRHPICYEEKIKSTFGSRVARRRSKEVKVCFIYINIKQSHNIPGKEKGLLKLVTD